MAIASSIRPGLAFLALPFALAAQDTDPPARAGRVSSVAGTVAFQAAGAPDWSLAPLNYTVTSGDRLLTHQRSRAEIEVGPYDVRLADSTDLSVIYLTDDFTQLGLNRGTIRVSVYRLASRDSMEVDTPNGAIIIRSAGRYRVDVLEDVSTIVTVEDGVVELSGPALAYTVKRGQSIELTGTSAISASMVPHPRNSEFDTWSNDRDRRQDNATYSRYMSRDIPGGADLDRYGHWEHHAAYGYVWRPTIVQVGWVPYRNGRWVWSGPWGWTWVENAPWGFAPFHYGRWVTVTGVWVWAPGPVYHRPYYAPALVVFVGGPTYGRHHQAWFPLGWNEPYYPRYRHSDRYLREVNIAHVRSISNVEAFVDPRRADRITYANRQATTVVASNDFGRRAMVRQATDVRTDDIARAPIVRDPWVEPPRIGSRAAGQPSFAADQPQPLRPRRDALVPQQDAPLTGSLSDPRRATQPSRGADAERPQVGEPRARSPLISRNQPPSVDGRRNGLTGGSTTAQASHPAATRPTEARPRPTLDPASSLPGGTDRSRPLIRRNGSSDSPATSGSSGSSSSGTMPSSIDRSRRGTIGRSAPPTPARTQPRSTTPTVERSQPSRTSSPPRETAPRRPASAGTQPPSTGQRAAPPAAQPPSTGQRAAPSAGQPPQVRPRTATTRRPPAP